jgi:N-methylhydantoinase B
MWERSIRPDSGGAGQYRGGCGQRLHLGVRTNQTYRFAPLFDRVLFAPHGYAGGHDGAKASIELSTGEKLMRKGTRDLAPDVEITLELPGGGGLGPPEQRDPALIAYDVLNGYVSEERARTDYPHAFVDDALLTRV